MKYLPFHEALEDCSRLAGKVPQASCLNEGDFPVIGQGKQPLEGFTNNSGLVFRGDLPVILFGDHTGAFKFIDRPFARGADGTKLFRPRIQRLDTKFAWHFLQTAKLPETGYDRKTKYLESLRIPLPPLEEQRRIAAILDKSYRLTQLIKSSISTIDLLKQATFRRAIAHRGIHAIKEPCIPLGDCLRFITSGGRGWSQYYSDTGSRFIRSGDVQMNKIIRSDPQHVKPPYNAEAKRTCVRDGDVLLTITGSRIGRVAPASAEDSGAFISQHVAIMRLDETKLIPSFASFFLSMPEGGQMQIKRSQYGQTKPGLNFEQIQKFSVPNLPLCDQVKVMSEIMAIDDLLKIKLEHANKFDEYLASANALAFS